MTQRIVIVDDHAASCEAMARLVEAAGYDVLTANDVPSAMHLLVNEAPDLLITDVRLEEYNGLQLIAMAPKPIRAIVVTGFEDRAIENDARRLGAEYLVKPVSAAVLCKLIAQVLTGSRSFTVVPEMRRAARQAPSLPVPVRVGQFHACVVDVSATGLRLEINSANPAELPSALTLHIGGGREMEIPINIVWRRHANQTWTCGATVAAEARAAWSLFVNELSV
jgi:DNA-binding response OmpR family regulator